MLYLIYFLICMITIRIVTFYNYKKISMFPKLCISSLKDNITCCYLSDYKKNKTFFSLFPGNAKDILLIHEEDAEEWALYLQEIFIHIVEREAILLYPLWSFSSSHLELLNLNAYKCKLLILSNSLLKDLTPKKCQFLEKILDSPESVVTLLCGMESSRPLFQLLCIPGSKWEISTEQEPEDYISVVRQILYRGRNDKLSLLVFKCLFA